MKRIRTLDGWRGFAILLVIVNHLATYLPRPGVIGGIHVGLFPLSLGGFGVDIFFALSGYIITLRLLEEERTRGCINLKAFYVRRAFRILPPALAYLAVLCLLAQGLHITDFRYRDVAGALLFFRNYQTWFDGFAGIYTAHFWSLAIEEHFYLFWPGLLVLAGRRRAAWFALAGALACAVWRHHDVGTFASFHWSWVHPTGTIFPVRTDVRLDGMLLGAGAAIVSDHTWTRSLLKGVPPAITLATFLLAVATVKLFRLQPALVTNLLLSTAICISAVQTQGLLHRTLNLRVFTWVGEISYGLYIWQQLFLLHPADGSLPLGSLNTAPWDLLASFVMATCSFYLLDRKLIPLGKRWSARVPAHAPGHTILRAE